MNQLDRLTAAFRDVFGDVAPANEHDLALALQRSGERADTLSRLLAGLPFDSVQEHLTAQGLEVGPLPLVASAGASRAVVVGSVDAPPCAEAAELEAALRSLSGTGDISALRSLLEGWSVERVGDPVSEPVRDGAKVTLEVVHHGQTFALACNPCAREAISVVQKGALRKVPLGTFASALARGHELDTTGCPRPTVGFAVSRIGGEDGVSLEVMHWMRIYQRRGFDVHVFTGERTASRELVELEELGVTVHQMPLANPNPRDEENIEEFTKLHVPGEQDASIIEDRVLPKAARIQESLERWIRARGIDLLHAENFTLPFYHLAMGVAVADTVQATGIPTVSRGHDFPDDRDDIYHWDRTLPETRALVNRTYMRSPSVGSISINTKDTEYFAARGIGDVMVVPNTINTRDPRITKKLSEARRAELKRVLLGRDDPHTFIALAPVRPVSRKRLDVGLQFLKITLSKLRAHDPEARIAMVITHDEVDGKPAELAALERAAAEEPAIELVYGHRRIREHNEGIGDDRRWFETWDQYHVGDLACYFSDYEGWGNALLETLACRVPTYVNEYQVFKDDIADKVDVPAVDIGPDFDFRDFLATGMAAFASRERLNAQLAAAADDAVAMLRAKGAPSAPLAGLWAARADHNYQAVREHYSYEVVGRMLLERMYEAFSATVAS